MTLTEAAAILGVSTANLRAQIARGVLRARKDRHGWWIVTASAVKAYEAKHLRKKGTGHE